jgi:hypothetical protein
MHSLRTTSVTCLAYFIILSEPFTLEHQTGGGLVNWIWHKKAAMDYAVVILAFGVIQENWQISVQSVGLQDKKCKHFLSNTRDKCFLFNFRFLLLWFNQQATPCFFHSFPRSCASLSTLKKKEKKKQVLD